MRLKEKDKEPITVELRRYGPIASLTWTIPGQKFKSGVDLIVVDGKIPESEIKKANTHINYILRKYSKIKMNVEHIDLNRKDVFIR